MNKKLLSLFLAATIIATNACALKSLTEWVNDEKAIEAGAFETEDKQMIEGMKQTFAGLDALFSAMTAKHKDETTIKYEEEINASILQYLSGIKENNFDNAILEKLTKVLEELNVYLKETKKATDEEVVAFIGALFATRLMTAAFEFGIENPNIQKKLKEKNKEVVEALQNAITKAEETYANFLKKAYPKLAKPEKPGITINLETNA